MYGQTRAARLEAFSAARRRPTEIPSGHLRKFCAHGRSRNHIGRFAGKRKKGIFCDRRHISWHGDF
jgi:hypothetical protein